MVSIQHPAQGQTTSADTPATTPVQQADWLILTDTADIEDIDLLTMEIPVVVTASRREQKITTLPYAVSIITAKDIRWSGARSVPDALRLAPGVDVAEISYGDAAVAARGLFGFTNPTLVLVDGRHICDSLFGGTLWGSWPFQLEDIERIEVIRGPSGVTWGGHAIEGVINIITKDPRDQLGLTITGGGGSRGAQKEHLGYAFAVDEKLRMRISGEYEGSDGFLKGGSFLRKLDDEYKCGRMALHAIYDAGPKDRFTFSGGSGLLNGGYPLGPFTGLAGSHNASSQASFLLGRWEHKIADENRFELNGFVNDFYWANGFSVSEYRYQQLALQYGHTFRANDTHLLTWGIDVRTDLTDASNADPFLLSKDFVSTAIIGLYLQDEWRFAPKWALNWGGRIDYEFYGGFQPSARAALSYELDDHSLLYGSVSRAFHMPAAAMRFMDEPLVGGIARVKGDRDSPSLSLIAYELGYRTKLFERLDANLNLYWHESTDVTFLRPGLGPPGLVRLNADGLGEASQYGLEIDVKYKVTDSLTLLGNYTFERLDQRWSLPYTFSTDMITPPKHKFMLGARYSPTDDLHLSSHLYYVDAVEAPNPHFPILARRIDPYFRLDLRAEYEFWNNRASVAVGVRHLLDPHHYEGSSMFFNDAEVPRMVYAEMRFRFE